MTKNNPFCEITPELEHLSELSAKCSVIDPELYNKYDVKRGLRDINGKGVLVGLTEISDGFLLPVPVAQVRLPAG